MNNRDRSKLHRSDSGFTLIELLVVLLILGLLATIVMPRLFGRAEEAKGTAAKVQIRVLEDALHQFEVDNGAYPTTEEGLDALVKAPANAKHWREGGYIEKSTVPKDPWGNAYIYLCPGSHGDYDLMSYGGDGAPGGEGKYKDITNWEESGK